MPPEFFITLSIATILVQFHRIDAGFTQGAPCSSRNTAYLSPSKPFFPADPVKCVDITGMGKSLIFDAHWPIQQADTLYADHMLLNRINKTMFAFMPNLELVDFTGNRIRRLPPAINAVIPKLTTFLLAKNAIQITKPRPVMRSFTLKTLMLSHNKIKALQVRTFAKVPALEVLYLDSNYLEFVTPKMFSFLTKLKYLHLGNNFLKRVPAKAYMPKTLNSYIVKGNPLARKKEAELLA